MENTLVSIYAIDTEYNTTLKVITLKEFYKLCEGA